MEKRTIEININWEDKSLYAGNLKVVSYYYNGLRPKGDTKVWKVACSIPGIKADLGNFETEKGAKDKCESVMKYFIDKLLSKAI